MNYLRNHACYREKNKHCQYERVCVEQQAGEQLPV